MVNDIDKNKLRFLVHQPWRLLCQRNNGSQFPGTAKSVFLIYINNHVFIPTNGRSVSGLRCYIEPVYILRPLIKNLIPIALKVMNQPLIQLPYPTKEELKRQVQLLPKITGTNSWKKLCKEGVSYDICLIDNGYTLAKSSLGKNSQWVYLQDDIQFYSIDTEFSVLAQHIIDNITR